MPNVPDLLQELRDVHMPDPISWWPPAFGWWAIMVVLVMVVSLVLWGRAYRQRTRPRRVALVQLEEVKKHYAVYSDDQWVITQVSNLFQQFLEEIQVMLGIPMIRLLR